MKTDHIQLLKNKLSLQKEVYEMLSENDFSSVCYKEYKDKTYGVRDEHYTNRLRLSYYLLYENIDDEKAIAALFKEELKDRQTNSFQGIGLTLEILTQLLRKYNTDEKYTPLFQQAKDANFDCHCGYDVDKEINAVLEDNSLLDCIFIAQDLEYRDIMEELVDQWKQTITQWDNTNRKTLIRFNSFLRKEEENENIYKQILASINKNNVFDIASAYKDIIGYYIEIKDNKTAYKYLKQLLNRYSLDAIKNIRLFAYFLEFGLDIAINEPETSSELWSWIKPELQCRKNMFGNLYTKGIAAAKLLHDPYAKQLINEFENWKNKTGIK